MATWSVSLSEEAWHRHGHGYCCCRFELHVDRCNVISMTNTYDIIVLKLILRRLQCASSQNTPRGLFVMPRLIMATFTSTRIFSNPTNQCVLFLSCSRTAFLPMYDVRTLRHVFPFAKPTQFRHLATSPPVAIY